MAGLFWPLLGVLAGAFIAVQAPINTELARGLGSTLAAAAISFVAGGLALALLTFVLTRAEGAVIDWRAPAPWLFFAGGLLGALYVTSTIILIPKVGAAALMAFLVTGQLIAGMVVDRIGFLGVAVREISAGRIAGALLLLVGAVMVRYL
ncbi:DMT family transporter [Pseudaminobacter sp. NGMCC 1.201702]|uniref:DMT family transporter n=1 Tax=Pseudaminobacter sp. NGMCC 1.201702 TaxID=3391825 RepID=UPI0039EF9123